MTAVWDALLRDDWREVERWLRDREVEGPHLDFKSTSAEPLSEDALANVAKAMSAFANVEGGVLALGVTTSREGKGPDMVSAIPGVTSANSIVAQLDRRLPSIVEPPVPGAQARAFEDQASPGREIVCVNVPRSEGGPHRAAIGKHAGRYFIRVGSNSAIAPHSILESMFGRRPPPKLRLAVCTEADGKGSLHVRNLGRGIARDALVRVTIAARRPQKVLGLTPGEFWDVAPLTQVRGEPEYKEGVYRLMLPIHALDTVRAATFDPGSRDAEIQILARIDADGMAPVLVKAQVELNSSHLVDVPAIGDDEAL